MGWTYDVRSRRYLHSSGKVIPKESAKVRYLEHMDSSSGTMDVNIRIILDVEWLDATVHETSPTAPNCVNCGAAAESPVCSYCGTHHSWREAH